MPRKTIMTEKAPKAVGPYAQAVQISGFKNLVYTSGQIAIDPNTGKLVEGTVSAQTHQVIKNLSAILETAGSSLSNVFKTTVFLKSMDDFKAMNEVYASYFTDQLPARSTVQVSRLPLDVDVEIEAIAFVD